MNSIIDGSQVSNYGVGGSVALISIAMVFLILLLIIVICELIGKAIEKATTKNEIVQNDTVNKTVNSLNPNDEDALVACLIASIEMRNQIKKNVRVINVRRVS